MTNRFIVSEEERKKLQFFLKEYLNIANQTHEEVELFCKNCLSQLSSNWNERNLLQWFTQNKSDNEKFMTSYEQPKPKINKVGGEIFTDESMIPPKKRASISLFSPQISRNNSPMYITTNLTVSELFLKEKDQSVVLNGIYDEFFCDNVAPPYGQYSTVNSLQTLPAGILSQEIKDHVVKIQDRYSYIHEYTSFQLSEFSDCPYKIGPVHLSHEKFDLIEAGTVQTAGESVIVSFDIKKDAHIINFSNNHKVPLPGSMPAINVHYDSHTNTAFILTRSFLYNYKLDSECIYQYKHNGTSNTACLASNKDALVLASKNCMIIFPRSSDMKLFSKKHDIELPMNNVSHCISLPNNYIFSSTSSPFILATNEEGQPIRDFIGHASSVTSLSVFDPNLFVSGSSDNSIKLWDLRDPTPTLVFHRHMGYVSAIHCNPNLHLIFSGGSDRKIRVWDERKFIPLYETGVGTGIPFDINLDTVTETLKILTCEAKSSTFDGLDNSRVISARPYFCVRPSNLYIKYHFRANDEINFV